MNNKIFIISYDNSSHDPNKDFDISESNIPVLREYNAFREFIKNKVFLNYDYSGIVSPKFSKKIGLSITKATKMINPLVDITLFHPYPLEFKLQTDFLQLAELEHPGIIEMLEKLWFQLYKKKLPVIDIPEYYNYICHSNFIIANKKFWLKYSYIVEKIELLISNGELNYLINSETSYHLNEGKSDNLSYFPFVFERLLTHFIYANKHCLSVDNISLQQDFKPVLLFKNEDILVNLLSNIVLFQNYFIKNKRYNWSISIYFTIRKLIYRIRYKREILKKETLKKEVLNE